MIMLYIDDDIESLDWDKLITRIPQQRRGKIMSLRNERDRRLGLAAYMLLCEALAVEYGIEAMPHFAS